MKDSCVPVRIYRDWFAEAQRFEHVMVNTDMCDGGGSIEIAWFAHRVQDHAAGFGGNGRIGQCGSKDSQQSAKFEVGAQSCLRSLTWVAWGENEQSVGMTLAHGDEGISTISWSA